MSLIHSAKLNGLDPYAYLRDVLERLPMQPASRITELLPHQWAPSKTPEVPPLTDVALPPARSKLPRSQASSSAIDEVQI